MATFTTTQTGNVNDGGTFGNTSPGVEGTDYPTLNGTDTIIISPGDTLTFNINCNGTVELSGSYVVNDGVTLTFTGIQLMVANFASMTLNAGSTLTMGAYGINASANVLQRYTWINNGTSVNKVTINGDGLSGGFVNNLAFHRSIWSLDWSYTDFSAMGLMDIRTNNDFAAQLEIDHCTTTDSGQIALSSGVVHIDTVLSITNCDWRDWDVDRPVYVLFPEAQTMTTTPVFSGNTFSNTSDSYSNEIRLYVKDIIAHDNVTDDCMWNFYETAVAHNNFQYGEIKSSLMRAPLDVHDNYFISEHANSHTLGVDGTAGSINVTTNIFEATISDTNHITHGSGSGLGGVVNNNISVGSGNLMGDTGNTDTEWIIRNNTCLSNLAPIDNLHLLYIEETLESAGNRELYDNLMVNVAAKGASTVNGVAGRPTATPDVIDYVDYNGFFDIDDHYTDVVISGKVEGDPGFGGSDITEDPSLKDSTVNLAGFSSSVGGTATIAFALAEFLKLNKSDYNTDYNINDLLLYVRDGVAPTNTAFQSVGRFSGDIGAVPVVAAAISITPNVGEIEILGFNPIVTAPKTYNFNAGEITIEGFNPVIVTSIAIEPNVGEVIIQGFNPIINLPIIMNFNVGEIVIRGYSPTIAYGALKKPPTSRVFVVPFDNRIP